MNVAGFAGLMLLTLPALAVDADGICRTPRAPGTGLNAQGVGYVHFLQTGTYVFHGVARIDGQPRQHVANTYAPVIAKGTVEWTRPDGVREAIPTTLLYPPT